MPSTMVNLLADEPGLSSFEFSNRPLQQLRRRTQRRRHEFRHDNRQITVDTATGLETAAKINAAFEQSDYSLCGIRCIYSGGDLILNGRASCYYHVQVALTTAMQMAGSRRVMCQVKVVSVK